MRSWNGKLCPSFKRKCSSEKPIWSWGWFGAPKFAIKKFRNGSVRISSRTWVSEIATLPVESSGRPGSEKKDQACLENQNWRTEFRIKSHTRTCPEVDKLRRTWCEETRRATQLKQERDLTTVSVLLSQIRDHQKKIRQNLCLKSKNVTIPVQRLVWRGPTFLQNRRTCRVPEVLFASSVDRLPIHGIYGYFWIFFFGSLPFEKDNPQPTSKILKIWFISFHTLTPEGTGVTRNVERGNARATKFVDAYAMLPKVRWSLSTYSWNLFSRWCGRIPKISRLEDASWKNSVPIWNSKADKSSSRLKYVQRQQIFTSHCNGSKKLR